MSLIIGIAILTAIMITCTYLDIPNMYGLFAGLVYFVALAMKEGFSLRQIGGMCWRGIKSADIVIAMMSVIGLLTASWRLSGTIGYFVYYGITIIQPKTFIIIAFVLTCLLSYAVGSSFAVSASMGVIFMALARAGGVNEVIMGGVIMSGVYFGDRGAPTSSCAMLVASCTETDHMDNVRRMMKYAIAPLLFTFALYCYYSFRNPIQSVDDSFLRQLEEMQVISPWCLVPAAIMLILPLLRVSVLKSIGLSLSTAIAISLVVQKSSFQTLIATLAYGYKSENDFGTIFNGGGLASMVSVIIIVIVSSMYAGIFRDTGMLQVMQAVMKRLAHKVGRFFSSTIIGMILSSVSCNQTFACLMTGNLMLDIYEEDGGTREELAADMQNSVVVLIGMLPWAIACSGPLSFMGASYSSIKYAFYLYLIPVFYFIEKQLVNRYIRQ